MRERRRHRKKQKARDACTHKDYQCVLSCIKSNDPIIKARQRVALTLLYMTGLRVSNLRNVYYHHLRDLKENITITMIQTRQDTVQQTFPWQSAYARLIQPIKNDIQLLLQSAGEEDGPFQLAREHLNISLNNILKRASALVGKHFRTHSFRIHLADRIIESKGVVSAQKIIMHKNINTTMIYNRTGITKRETANVLRTALDYETLNSAASPLMDEFPDTSKDLGELS